MEYWKDILAPTVRYKFYGGDVIKSAMACEEVQGAIQDIRHELAEDTRRSESFLSRLTEVLGLEEGAHGLQLHLASPGALHALLTASGTATPFVQISLRIKTKQVSMPPFVKVTSAEAYYQAALTTREGGAAVLPPRERRSFDKSLFAAVSVCVVGCVQEAFGCCQVWCSCERGKQ